MFGRKSDYFYLQACVEQNNCLIKKYEYQL